LFYYLIKIGVKKYKTQELLDCLETFSVQFRNDSGCLDCNIYQDCDNSLSYTLVCEWQTFLAMQQHFRTHDFKILIGATKVLGEASELLAAETITLPQMN
jgi:quinol monooxygenase YgiN